MIPKKIHYCWFGGAEPSDVIKRCMRSWQKHLPDWQFYRWSEDNFDVHTHPFVEEAYRQKKWAYVSDFTRLWALEKEGGIYLDTDVLLLQNLTPFCLHRAFVGYERPDYPFTAVFGAEAHHPMLKGMLEHCIPDHFDYSAQDPYRLVNTKTVSEFLVQHYHCQLGNIEQDLADGIHVYPDTVLCNPSENSATIHLFTGTWLDKPSALKKLCVREIKSRLTTTRRAKLYQKFFRQ